MQRTLTGKTIVVHASREEYDVYIGRPGPFGNPFHAGTKAENIRDFEAYVRARPGLMELIRINLRDKRLGCWCKPEPCHGDVLARIADE